MNALVPVSDSAAAIVERVVIQGDLSKLTPKERVSYYNEVCKSVGLNPLTKPFEYISLNSKLTLYALRACTDQLRSIYSVSVEDLSESEREGVFIVTAKVRNGQGRTDIAKGAVNIAGLKGEVLANALMKAETKAKRRATLSICGLGWLDESEVDSIPGAVKGEPPFVSTPPSPPSPPSAPKNDGPAPIPVPVEDGKERFTPWGKQIIAAILAAPDYPDIDAIIFANQEAFGRCGEAAPKAAESIKKAIAKRSNELMEGQKQAPAAPQADLEMADWMAELDACETESAVEDIRARAVANMFPGDLEAFKVACATKSAELF